MLVRNAIYKHKSCKGTSLYHVNSYGNISTARYRNERGHCLPTPFDYTIPALFMFNYEIYYIHNRNHWHDLLIKEGCIVASHVVDPRKLTSRQLRKMARK